MNVLFFCHHPDVLHYMYRAFQALGHKIYIADEELTKKFFNYSSVRDNKFEVVDQLFEPAQLFPDMKDIEFMSIDNILGLMEMDLYCGMLPEVTNLAKNYGLNTWFDGQMQAYLRDKRFSYLPGIKSANHPNAWELNGFHFVPNWVDKQPDLISKTYLTQMVTECNLVATTRELIILKNEGYPVKIHGGSKCPDGFIRDINILPYTSMLVHDKQFGVNCYAVCKALDMGIPIYMSRKTRDMIGFGDVPESCFFFSDEWGMLEAFEVSKNSNTKKIQETYRSIYTLDRTIKAIETIL